jgi:two-component system phosphate regulon response regulator PhoB
MELHGIILYPDNNEAILEGQPLPLTRTQFRLLHFLTSHAGETHTRQELIVAVHGPDYPATDGSIDSQILGLRKKLGDRGRVIECVRGVGFRFVNHVSE